MIGMSGRDQVILGVGLTLVVAAVLAALPTLARWALTGLPWIPWQGPLELTVVAEEHLTLWGMAGIGLVLGAVLSLLVVAGEPVVEISERHILVTKGDERHRFARSQVGMAGVDGKHLVVHDRDDVELLHLKVDRRQEIGDALTARGWPATGA